MTTTQELFDYEQDALAAFESALTHCCEPVAKRIQGLAQAQPGCGACYDKVLDLLSDCKERHAFHA
jgi:hypothetical protein